MPVATSPYQNNDYRAANTFQPYQLPINEVAKAWMAQNQFWDQGAARVKSAYDNALGLNLTLQQNKEIRDKFMEDAEKQLTKLSTMDLSNPAVQRKGIGIFKPLFQDEGIIFDDLMTKHYQKVRSDALSFREKDNGKGYSDINLMYAMDGYEDFANSQDRMAGKKFFQQRKEYTPYYDYTLDYDRALKNCPSSSASGQSPFYQGEAGKEEMTGYMLSTSSKFRSAEQARNCIEAGLSPNGLRQLQIEGAVNYRNNKPVLAADTVDYLSTVSANLSNKIQELAGQKTAARESKELKEEQKTSLIALYDEQIKQLTSEVENNTDIVTKLNKGDYSPIDEDPDRYAGSIYTYRKLYKKALAAAFEEREQKYIADPAQLQAKRFQQDLQLREIDYNYDVSLKEMDQLHDKEMKLFDLMYGGKKDKDGKSATGSPIYKNPVTGEWEVNPNIEWEKPVITNKPTADKEAFTNIKTQLESFNSDDRANNLKLYNDIITKGEKDQTFREELLRGFDYPVNQSGWEDFKRASRNNRFIIQREGQKTGGIQETSWFNAYFPLKKDDPTFNDWANKTSDINIGIKVLSRKLELGEKQVASELGLSTTTSGAIYEKIKDIKPITVNGTPITAADVQAAIEGGSGKVRIVKQGSQSGTSYTGSGSGVGYSYTPEDIYVNGVKVNDQSLRGMVTKIRNQAGSLASDIDKKRAEVYGGLGFDRDKWALTYDDESPFIQRIRTAFPTGTAEDQLNKTINVVASDFAGGVKLSVPWAKAGNADDIEKIRNLGIGIPSQVEIPQDGVVILRGTNYNVVPKAIDNPTMKNVAYQLQTITATRDFQATQPGAKVPNSDIQIPVYIAGKRRKANIEIYNNGGGQPEFRVYIEDANTTEPQARANNAYDLLEKLARMPIEFKQPIR